MHTTTYFNSVFFYTHCGWVQFDFRLFVYNLMQIYGPVSILKSWLNLPRTTDRCALFTSHSREFDGPISIFNSWSTYLRLYAGVPF